MKNKWQQIYKIIISTLIAVLLTTMAISISKRDTDYEIALRLLSNRIELMESNHVELIRFIDQWNQDEVEYNTLLITKIHDADSILNSQIAELRNFNLLVIEKLKQIATFQNSFIDALTTNVLDTPEKME